MRRYIDLTPAGPDWREWQLKAYGRARSFRLITPEGAALTAGEIDELRELQYNVTYLQSRVRRLSEHLAPLEPEELAVIEAALTLIRRRLLPAAPRARGGLVR